MALKFRRIFPRLRVGLLLPSCPTTLGPNFSCGQQSPPPLLASRTSSWLCSGTGNPIVFSPALQYPLTAAVHHLLPCCFYKTADRVHQIRRRPRTLNAGDCRPFQCPRKQTALSCSKGLGQVRQEDREIIIPRFATRPQSHPGACLGKRRETSLPCRFCVTSFSQGRVDRNVSGGPFFLRRNSCFRIKESCLPNGGPPRP